MISDARGGHVSPGVYTEERDVTYSAKSLGITNLGLAGETLKGPAFQAIEIKDWTEFVDYFGGTSPEKFKGTGYPKYELPYIAKSYLTESKNLNVVRVLGLSGYEAGSAYTVTAKAQNGQSQPVVVLRSKADYKGSVTGNTCGEKKQEAYRPWVSDITISEYKGSDFTSECAISGNTYTIGLTGKVYDIDGQHKLRDSSNSGYTVGGFGVDITYQDTYMSASTPVHYNVSLNPYDRDYIYNVFSTDPLIGSAPVYIEAVFDYAFDELIQNTETGNTITLALAKSSDYFDYKEAFRCAQTPWIVSEVKAATSDAINIKKLFKIYTISDGNAANYQVKISIQRIRPEEGLFDLVVRDFYDTDNAQVVLEKFANLSMVEGSSNFIGLKIGTFDGGYVSKSKYITVMLSGEDGIESCVPCGFLGYPVPEFGAKKKIDLAYNTKFDDSIKPKRQYFGLNSDILDEDILNYKGEEAYNNANYDFDPSKLTNGFHLDAILNPEVMNPASGSSVFTSATTLYVDNVSGFTFTTVDTVQIPGKVQNLPRIISESYMGNTIYEDINLRKFTVYPYGGFDGWDIYREERTNTNDYKATRYPIVTDSSGTSICPFEKIGNTGNNEEDLILDPTLELGLPANAINSDYYAYLAGYRQFANPSDIDINLFATPGIDWKNNTLLTEDALDMIEDQEDGRGGDALYIMDAPMDEDSDTLDAEGVVYALDETDIVSSYACTYWPWVKFYDKDAKMYLDLPVTKDVVRNMAATDNKSYPWFAPAGVERGTVECVKAAYKTTLSDEDTLYQDRVNPIKTFAKDGVKVWGNKTLYDKETPLNRINVRRLMLRVKKLVVDASKSLIFEQYDNTIEKQFRSLVEPILADVKSNRGIYDYRIMTESTPETRDQHILPARILIKPTPALEYISISFVVYPESVEFESE